MTKQEFENYKEKAKIYPYHSFEYLEYAHVADFKLIQNDGDLLLIYGEDPENEINTVYWAAGDLRLLPEAVRCLGHNILVKFIPPDFRAYFAEQGFSDYAVFRDYVMEDIGTADCLSGYSLLEKEEYGQGSFVTCEVKNQSRGFHGETKAWVESWIKGEDPDAMACDGIRDCNILVNRDNKTVTGVACVGIYGDESKKGPVLWLREIAVLPQEQGKGIGKKLILQSLGYGKERGAKRAFLMADDCNTNAIGLYKSVGFVPSEDAEINMVSE